MKKKTVITISSLIFLFILIYSFIPNKRIINDFIFNFFKPPIKIQNEYSKADKNKNGIPDSLDIVLGAKEEVKKKTPYKSNYYKDGYPPESEGVCTDVIWRAFKNADINLKDLIDEDIKNNAELYKRVNGKPDPNIDFRRVPNLDVFLKRYCLSLTTEVKCRDKENLSEWQPGDIVVFLDGYEHIGIISDERDKNGIPYVLHNTYPHANKMKLSWFSAPIHGHYRWKY